MFCNFRVIPCFQEVHRTKPADTVHYSKPMPDIEQLMQEWPPEVEERLKKEIVNFTVLKSSIAVKFYEHREGLLSHLLLSRVL